MELLTRFAEGHGGESAFGVLLAADALLLVTAICRGTVKIIRTVAMIF